MLSLYQVSCLSGHNLWKRFFNPPKNISFSSDFNRKKNPDGAKMDFENITVTSVLFYLYTFCSVYSYRVYRNRNIHTNIWYMFIFELFWVFFLFWKECSSSAIFRVLCQCLDILCTYENASTIRPTPHHQDVEADYLTSCYKYKKLTPSWNQRIVGSVW